MKTYRIIQLVEMTIAHTVRADNTTQADQIATERTLRQCRALAGVRSNIEFGDVADDYVPATDPD